jgi:glycosyltransferase involved in cell wall biosynthesis
MTTVAICIVTYRRPSMLRGALQSLEGLDFSQGAEPAINVVVVDNDAAASAYEVVVKFQSRFALNYVAEPRRGVSFARNAALANARAADFIAFLDDDEQAAPQWLDELLAVQRTYNAAIVAAPVLPRFEVPPPLWLLEGGFFHRQRHATGIQLHSAGAGNVLIAREVIEAMSPAWFDLRFNFTGGEDTHFFRRAMELGFMIAWANQALAYELIPAARTRPQYLVARARNGANHWTRVDLELHHNFTQLAARFGVGLLRLLQGSVSRLFSPALSARQKLRGRLRFAEGLGNLDAFIGRVYHAYGPRDL